MADEKKGDDKDKQPHPEIAENAATTYGLEDHEATAQDPRVTELKNSRSHHNRRSLQPGAKPAPTPRVLSTSPSRENNPAKASAPKPIINFSENLDKAATLPGVEDQIANQKDPLVLTVRQVKPTTPPSHSQEQLRAPQPEIPVTPSDRFYSIVPDEEEVVINKEKPNLVSTFTNTDVTFDPSKEYATRTTNTSGKLFTDDEDTPEPPEPPPPVPESTVKLDDCYAFAVDLVRKAGNYALASNKERLSYTTKEHEKDLNTRTDTDLEEMMTKAILDKYPDHKIIAEEAVSASETGKVTLTKEPTWIIDPIDGTMNYVHHFPYYCIALAFLVDSITEFGIVFNPPLQEFYTAQKGKGAELNGRPITTSGQETLKKAMILQEYSSGMNEARTATSMENAKILIKKTHALRSIGSSAMGLAMIASGVADAFYFFGLHVWDMAAGNILVTEAGGTVIDPSGGEIDIMSRRVLAAATLPLAIELSSQLLQNFPSPRDDEPRKGAAPLKKDFQAQTDFTDSSASFDSDTSRQFRKVQ